MISTRPVFGANVTLPPSWNASSHHIDLGSAIGRVHYVDFGNPVSGQKTRQEIPQENHRQDATDLAPVVLVHGLGGSYVNWVALGPLLAVQRRVFALDLPGFGRSEPGGRSARVTENAAALAAFIDQVVGAPPLIIGNSMGGMLSIMYAATHPTSAVVLINPVLPRVPGQPLDREVTAAFLMYAIPGVGTRMLARARARTTPHQTVTQIMRVVAADPATIPQDLFDASVELVTARADVPGIDRAYLQAARSLLRVGAKPKSYRAMMRAITSPVLLIHGTHDRLVPVQAARAAAKTFPDWTYVELPDAGHVPHMEAAKDVEKHVLKWISAEDLR